MSKKDNFCNEAYYTFFSTLASRTRLAILDVLRNGSKTPTEISKLLELEQQVVSMNLKAMEKCAIIISDDSGKEKLYSPNREIIESLSENLAFHTNKYSLGLTAGITPQNLKEYMKKEAEKELYLERR